MEPLCLSVVAYAALMTAASASPVEPIEFAQLTIRQSVVIRVPTRPGPPPVDRTIKWKEIKGPKCIPINAMRGAVVVDDDRIDLILRGGQRLRARLDGDCRALDFYSSFYVKATPDGRFCADRDLIHTRGGAKCAIERFRSLTPDK